tara:strand:+ start:362 stop:544 length:183 start_codon:yes stop_codon:yes gene_type:complete
MKVGDLVRPKCKYNFESLGYAIISEICERQGRAIIIWVDDQTDHYMRWWELEEHMEVVCK